MELSVIPCITSERAAMLWFGVTSKAPPGMLRLHVSGVEHHLPAASWIPLRVKNPDLDSRTSAAPFWYFRHRLEPLTSDTVFRVQAELGPGGESTTAVSRPMLQRPARARHAAYSRGSPISP